MYRLTIYIPEQSLEDVKRAIFKAGAGKLGNYDNCCWQTKGQGQFRPLENSQPALGDIGRLEFVAEYKVEVICEKQCLQDVIEAIHASHPYEEPAYQYWQVNTARTGGK